MPMLPKTVVDADMRMRVFADAIFDENDEITWVTINDRQYGCILTDKNGHERYCRLGVIVAEEREDMTARELMQAEIDEYRAKQASKAEKAKAKEEKIARDKKAREEKAKKEEGE